MSMPYNCDKTIQYPHIFLNDKSLNRILYSNLFILYIFLLAFLVRLLVGLLIANPFNTDYWLIARNLAQKQIYSLDGIRPTAFRTPGYPLILAGLIGLFGEQRLPFVILMATVGAANASLCAWLSAKLFNRKVAVTAGLLYTFLPYLAQKEVTTEGGLVTLGLLFGTCLLWKAWHNKKNIIFICLCGMMFSFAFLIRPTVGLIPILIFFSLLLGRPLNKRIFKWRILSAILFLLSFIIGILPWAVRNYKAFGRPYLMQTNFWYNVYVGNHSRAFQIYPRLSLDNFILMAPAAGNLQFTNELEGEEWLRQQALIEIKKSRFKDIIKRSFLKLVYLWHFRLIPYSDRIGNDPLSGRTLDKKRGILKNITFSIPYLALVAAALAGCWQERKRTGLLLFMAGFLIFFSIPYMLTLAYSRYTTQVYFVLIIMASRGLISSAFARKPRPRAWRNVKMRLLSIGRGRKEELCYIIAVDLLLI